MSPNILVCYISLLYVCVHSGPEEHRFWFTCLLACNILMHLCHFCLILFLIFKRDRREEKHICIELMVCTFMENNMITQLVFYKCQHLKAQSSSSHIIDFDWWRLFFFCFFLPLLWLHLKHTQKKQYLRCEIIMQLPPAMIFFLDSSALLWQLCKLSVSIFGGKTATFLNLFNISMLAWAKKKRRLF